MATRRSPFGQSVFDVLVYFIQNRGRVVSKEELLEKIWSDVVVNDATLNRTVTELRAALGDNADHPRYIETVSPTRVQIHR